MVFYVRQGNIPELRHTYDDRKNILKEELLGEDSFEGPYSLLYHRGEPTRIREIEIVKKDHVEGIESSQHRLFRTRRLTGTGDIITNRKILLGNDSVLITFSRIDRENDHFFRHGLRNMLFYVHRGGATFESIFGSITIKEGDYLLVPKGTTFRFKNPRGLALLAIESKDPIEVPGRYLNRYGQLKEGAPYHNRNITYPILDHTEKGKEEKGYAVYVDFDDHFVVELRDESPLDVAGWDGYNYPFTINVRHLMPMVGKVHLPPPFHETFSSKRFMVASFLPRPFDFHERSIPISYYHSNVDTDEFLFYSSGNFMSRRGIDEGSITLHVRGMIHGPQPGAVEESIGKQSTDEIGIMVETYDRLKVFPDGAGIEDEGYFRSWYK